MKPKLYIGTVGMSVWFSEDLGETWSRPNSEHGMSNESRVWALASHAERPAHILAGTDRGIYRWEESAGKWHLVPSPLDGKHVWALAYAPHDPNVVMAGISPGALYLTTDGAESWRLLDISIPEKCMFNLTSRVTQILFDPIDKDTIWASVEIDALHRSTDGGKTWKRLSNGLETDDVHGVAVMKNGNDRIVLAALNRGIHRSVDNGETFQKVELPSIWQYTRAVVPGGAGGGRVYATNGDGPPGSWGRLFRSDDFGSSWHELPLPARTNSTLWTISTHPHDPDLIFVCSNLGQLFRSRDGGDSWVKLDRELGEIRSAMWRPV